MFNQPKNWWLIYYGSLDMCILNKSLKNICKQEKTNGEHSQILGFFLDESAN